MPRPMWRGSISFGPLVIPVEMRVAVQEDRTPFHMLHVKDHARLQTRLFCSAEEKEVHREHIVRGFEYTPGQFVVITDAELESLAPKASKLIELERFVDADSIDPIYYDRPYYLEPGEGASKAFRLVMEAMRKSGKIALARFVMHEKEYLAALRPVGNLICLSTMHFGAEVLEPPAVPHGKSAPDRDLDSAVELIKSLKGKYDPERYENEHHHRIREMLKRKEKGKDIVEEPAVAEDEEASFKGRHINLTEMLEASLKQARKGAKESAGGTSKRGGRKPAAHTGHHGETRRRKSA
jgi:DNA end-binding protein Ku